jgi:peptide/nickel transport system substrate-binding protein
VYDLAKARQLLAEAGFRNGVDAGDYYCDSTYANLAEAVINNLQEAGIRAKLRPLERAAFFAAYSEKKLKNIIQGASAAFGNAATRLDAFVVKGGAYAYGNYPEIDAQFAEQAVELDVAKRTKMLHGIQRILHERSVYAPIWQLAFLNGQGKRVGQSGLGLIPGYAFSAPYEDVTIKQN